MRLVAFLLEAYMMFVDLEVEVVGKQKELMTGVWYKVPCEN